MSDEQIEDIDLDDIETDDATSETAASDEPRHPTGLNAEQRASFEQYVHTTAENIGLYGWELTVLWDSPADPDCNAQVTVVEGRQAAVIHPGLDMDTMPRADVARVVIHELLHCHLDASKAVVLAGVKEHLAPAVHKSLSTQAALMEEFVVDRISSALASWLPEPTFLPRIPAAREV